MREPIPLPHAEPKMLDMPPAEFEKICQRAAREAIIRNAKLGFPAVSCENGQIVFTPPEQVLAKFGIPAPVNTNDVSTQPASSR